MPTWRISTFLPFTHTIYTLIIHRNCREAIQREKTLDRFSTTHTPILLKLVKNHCNLFFFPLPLSYLQRRFVPKHNPHLFRVQRMFWSLGSFGDLPKEVGEAWWMQSGILQDSESQKRHGSRKPCWSRSLEGLGALSRLSLEGLLLFVYPNLLFSGSIYRLEGGKEFFHRVLWFFSSITRLDVILQLHLSFLTLVLYFQCLLFMFMHQSTCRFIVLHLLLFCTQISQSKSNLAATFNWGSKQALVF